MSEEGGNNVNISSKQLKRRFRNYLPHLPGDLLRIFIMLIVIFPFYWMIVSSFKTYNDSISVPPTLWPKVFTVDAYDMVIRKMNWLLYAKNSVVVTLSTIALQLIIMVPAAYAFAKYQFYADKILFGIVLIAFMVPSQITFITVYMTMAKAKLLTTLWPQIIPFGANAFGIFMLRQSFKQISNEIVESARLDAASEFKIMIRIMLPMTKSAMLTIALFTFIGTWNAYFWPLVMTTTDNVRPLTIGIEKLKDVDMGYNWPAIMAGNTLLVLPVLVFYFFASKQIMTAFTYSGVK